MSGQSTITYVAIYQVPMSEYDNSLCRSDTIVHVIVLPPHMSQCAICDCHHLTIEYCTMWQWPLSQSDNRFCKNMIIACHNLRLVGDKNMTVSNVAMYSNCLAQSDNCPQKKRIWQVPVLQMTHIYISQCHKCVCRNLTVDISHLTTASTGCVVFLFVVFLFFNWQLTQLPIHATTAV